MGANDTDPETEMRLRQTLACTAMAASASGVLAAATRENPDEAAVRRHIGRYYFEGVRRSDTAAAHRAFHPVVTMYFVRDGAFAQRTIPDWLAGIAERAPSPPAADTVPRRILDVDVTGSAAMAKLELAYPEAVVTDYMSLLKVKGEWTIVGKIFERRPR
jgi:Putative lumazine-binding